MSILMDRLLQHPIAKQSKLHGTIKESHFTTAAKDGPVGAARRMSFCWDCHSWTMALVAKVLPQPGPPVSTISGALLARMTAAFCPSLSGDSLPAAWVQHMRLRSHHSTTALARPCWCCLAPFSQIIGSLPSAHSHDKLGGSCNHKGYEEKILTLLLALLLPARLVPVVDALLAPIEGLLLLRRNARQRCRDPYLHRVASDPDECS